MLDVEGDGDSGAVTEASADTNGDDDTVDDAVDDVQNDEEKEGSTVNVVVKLFIADVVSVPLSILCVVDGKLL
jgi:hypothetical protein